MLRLQKESDILDEAFRKRVIEEIESAENKARKLEAWKRYQCYKDKTSNYVVDLLLSQFDQATVREMLYSLSNISIVKKVVGKLARVYSNGVVRMISGDEESTKKLQDIEKKLDLNSALKKANRFLRLQQNVDLFIKPVKVEDNGVEKYKVAVEVLNPFHYDVIEDAEDRRKAKVVILSDWTPPLTEAQAITRSRSPLPLSASTTPTAPTAPKGNGKDEVIADTPVDQVNHGRNYVFWSKNYHFTCDSNGKIIPELSGEALKNPLGVFNHINLAYDQDSSFWSEGGNDLIDGAVLINALITHTLHVGVVQGYGQFYMTGEKLPRSMKVGPTQAIIVEYKKDEQAEPKLGFLSANPQLDSLRSLIEMYIALYLTSNNLSTTGISTQLNGSASLASGVALIIDKAESLEDVQDQRQLFVDSEPDIIEAINATLKSYGNTLVEELKGLELPPNFKQNYVVSFNDPTPIISEKEKLENLKLRRELGLDTMITLLMKEDPSLTEEQAEEKLKKIIEQRLKEKMLEGSNEIYDDQNQDPNADDTQDPEGTQDPAATPTPAPNGTPTVGDTATAQDVQRLALNGAQVSSLVEIVEKVAQGTLPRESALNMIVLAFNVTPEDAEKILGQAGQGFEPTAPTPAPVATPTPEPDNTNEV